MIRRELSMTPVAIRARERRFNHWLKREEDKFKAEVKIRMDDGLSFDEAWIAAGGSILSLQPGSSRPHHARPVG